MEKPEINLHLIDDTHKLTALLDYCLENNFETVAFDTETDSAQEKLANLYGIGLYFGFDDAFYIAIRNKDGSPIFSLDTLKQTVNSLLVNKKLITHNGLYDVLVIENNLGINLTQFLYHDTILSKHMVDEERPFALKDVAVKYLGAWADKAQKALHDNIKLNGGKTTKDEMEMYKADTDVLADYCCFDTILTYMLYNIFDKKIKEDKRLECLYEEEVMPLYREVTIDMKRRGFPIDLNHFSKLKQDIQLEINSVENQILKDIAPYLDEFNANTIREDLKITPRSEAGKLLLSKGLELEPLSNDAIEVLIVFYKEKNKLKHIFNLNSNKDLCWLFFDKLGIECKEKTEKGSPKLDAEILEELAKEHIFASSILEYKKLQKLLSTYIEGILDRQVDGKLYASFLQFGTTSGRYSCVGPNLQNMPRVKDEDAGLPPLVLKYVNAIKEGLIAGKGYKIVNADFSQLEPCCFAANSGDYLLQKVFHDKHDLYSAIAIEVEGLQKEYSADKKATNYLKNHKPELRQKFKAIALGIVYGAEEYRVASLLGCSVEEAKDVIKNYLNTYPGLKSYMQQCDKSVFERGEVVSKFGRVRHLEEAKFLFKRYGEKLLDRRWSKMNDLSETRWKLKNMLNLSKNHPIQALASHIVNRAAIAIVREFKANNIDGYLAANVHDELTAIVREDQAEQAKAILKSCMENTTKIEVPLVAEPLIGNNWAESK